VVSTDRANAAMEKIAGIISSQQTEFGKKQWR
jgi:hypothetical protein